MKTHFVVLAFTPEHEGDVKGIPWPEILAGAVKVTNWQYVYEPVSQEKAMLMGMNDCISSHDCSSDEAALQLLIEAAEKGEDVPDEITIYEPFETHELPALLEAIESAAGSYTGIYIPLTQPLINDESDDKILNCAKALLSLYNEVKDSDGFNPNLEGPENDAEQGALKALQEAGLI